MGTVGTLGAIASLLVAILPLILLPAVLSWAVDMIHSAQQSDEVLDCILCQLYKTFAVDANSKARC